jgi:hypothetical protein
MQDVSQQLHETNKDLECLQVDVFPFYRTFVRKLDADVRRAMEESAVALSRSQRILAKLERGR